MIENNFTIFFQLSKSLLRVYVFMNKDGLYTCFSLKKIPFKPILRGQTELSKGHLNEKKRNGRLPLFSLICIPSYISLSWEQNLFLPQQIVMCRTRRLSSCYVHSSWGKGQRSKDGTYQVPLWQRRSFNVICIDIQTAVKYFNVNCHCNRQGNLSSNYLVLLPGYAT